MTASKKIDKYTALVMQPHVTVAEDRDGITKNLDRALNMIDFGVGYFWELPAKLAVFPEYFMQGVTTPGKGEHGIDSFMKKAITLDGPEMQRLGDKAREYGMYIAGGGVIEQVPEFPDRWFNTAFIIGPSGDVVLKYHKWHIPASIGLGTSPHDIFDEYCEVFGGDIKTLFPVIDTEIGKLGTMTCHDGCTPEVSRALGYNGAEVICHPVALQEVEGVSEPWDFWVFTRRTRAHDNMAYVLGSNWGTVDYDFYPRAFCPGGSFGIDYTGMMMRHAPYPQEQVLGVTIDIEGLREHRSRCNHNTWVDVRTEGFRQIYEKPIYPANQFPSGRPPRTLADKMGPVKEVFRDLYGRGQFTPPAGMTVDDMANQHERRVKAAQAIGTLKRDD
ncbi:nitrilase-related carbon-nitrogen hydrolase [Sphingopyxis sp.]|uniref:nitrilase-related carbon-nitrogen hydrolase n=1 Tax=Sphingopyxis sp. TaxID=1908224 RepID=UPI0026186874|nr:nitrilase-related carbon-nitrogen hydrolase [Sphingopyxis sp.]MCW0199496.1 nitrilase [Sphingopyxis sp.]